MKLTKFTIAAGLAAAFACGSALAQTALVEVSDGTIVAPFDVAADVLDDFDVYTPAGDEIGDVEEVVGTDAGTATHLVVDFDDDDGFADRDDVLVPIEAFTLEANLLVVSLSVDEVSALPAWDD